LRGIGASAAKEQLAFKFLERKRTLPGPQNRGNSLYRSSSTAKVGRYDTYREQAKSSVETFVADSGGSEPEQYDVASGERQPAHAVIGSLE
jgi:hypothetical protein